MKYYSNYRKIPLFEKYKCDGCNTSKIFLTPPEDELYKSEITGGNISTWRAEIKYMKFLKNHEVLPKIQALDHIMGTMIHSNKFDHTHYEYKRLWKEYNNLLDDYNELINEIDETEKLIKQYLTELDKRHNQAKNK